MDRRWGELRQVPGELVEGPALRPSFPALEGRTQHAEHRRARDHHDPRDIVLAPDPLGFLHDLRREALLGRTFVTLTMVADAVT